jgi:hypothetical protein
MLALASAPLVRPAADDWRDLAWIRDVPAHPGKRASMPMGDRPLRRLWAHHKSRLVRAARGDDEATPLGGRSYQAPVPAPTWGSDRQG